MSKKLTTKDFIERSKKQHGDKYDYSEAEYVNNRAKTKIRCKKHNIFFEQVTDSHMRGQEGCPNCKQEQCINNGKKRRKTTKQFRKEAKKIHGNKYDYSLTKYINSTTEITIICPEHGEFIQKPCNHLYNGCKKCKYKNHLKNKKIPIKLTLLYRYPEISSQWHPTKNGNITPKTISYGSGREFWWVCEKGHVWIAPVGRRTNNDSGCPYCTGRKVCKDNCLSTLYPKVAKLWHPTKNGNITPENITHHSGQTFWWKCYDGKWPDGTFADDHEWDSKVATRVDNKGCPFCSGRAVTLSNCLATTHPDIAAQWHPTKNGDLTPYDVTFGSGQLIWWICKNGHE